jgi:DNA modification methylase
MKSRLVNEAYVDRWLQIWEGDCREVMSALPAASVHTVITSPPYFGLRDYGHDDQIGLEATPDAYIEHLIQVARAVRHVLRDDGIFWLNLGDSYSSGSRTSTVLQSIRRGQVLDNKRGKADLDRATAATAVRPPRVEGIKPKDMFGIPWRVAFALQADGWYLRRDIVWAKPNPMPESVDDRPTSSHEYIFMLTKRPDYFYDGFAVKEPISEAMAAAIARGPRADREFKHDEHSRFGKRSGNRAFADPDSLARIALGRNRRSVWTIPTVSYSGAHYAVFPPKLVEPMIKASTSENGVCEMCGAPSVRAVKTVRMDHHETTADGKTMDGPYAAQAAIRSGIYVDTETVGWERSCAHDGGLVPATVLDPFAGSGTVGMVSNRLSRRAVLIDINAEYLKLQMERNQAVPLGL